MRGIVRWLLWRLGGVSFNLAPAERQYIVGVEARAVTVAAESRAMTVDAEARALVVEIES